MTALAIFSYVGQDVRTVQVDGEPWFITIDVAAVLGFPNVRSSVALLDDDERGVHTLDTLGGMQPLGIVSEAGLYSLILRSRKEEAKQFKRWITHTVLPEIRQSGSFRAPAPVELSRMDILTMAIESETRALTAEAALAEVSPRADAWDALASAKGDYSVGDAAKMLARAGIPTGPARLFTQLGTLKWTYRNGDGCWRAYAERVESGHLAEKPSFHYHPKTGERVVDPPQVRVTIKGLERLRLRLHVGALVAVPA